MNHPILFSKCIVGMNNAPAKVELMESGGRDD